MIKIRFTAKWLVCLILISLTVSACSSPSTSTAPPTSDSPVIQTTEIAQVETTPHVTTALTEATIAPELMGTGNTFGNIINSGLIASKDGWVYYNSSPYSKKNVSALYRTKIDGTKTTKLSDDSPYFINVIGEWIIYINASDEHMIYRIKTDGTGREKLNDKSVWSITFVDNWLYYTQQYSPPKFKKMKVDGSETTVIDDGEPELMGISNAWIYYFNDDDKCIYKMQMDGTQKMKLTSAETSYFTVEGDWLYYILDDENTLNRIKTDGSNNTKLADDFKGGLPLIQGDLLYYLKSGALNSMKLDGTGNVQVFKDSMRTLNYADGWFYYSNGVDEKLYRVKVDGTGKELFGQ